MCSCKSSAAHFHTSGLLKVECAPHVVPSTAHAVSGKPSREGVKEEAVHGKHEMPKGCIRKPPPRLEVGKKRVQWMDRLGKELAEIKEFESSETGDADNEEESSCCLCVIL